MVLYTTAWGIDALLEKTALPESLHQAVLASFRLPRYGSNQRTEYYRDYLQRQLRIVRPTFDDIDPRVPLPDQHLLRRALFDKRPLLELHVLLHGLGLTEHITLVGPNGPKETIDMETWEHRVEHWLPESDLEHFTALDTIPAFCEDHSIERIAYDPAHIEATIEHLSRYGSFLRSPLLLRGIRIQDVVREFTQVDPERFQDRFGDWSEEDLPYALIVAYIHQAAWIDHYQTSSVRPFLNLLKSRPR